MTSIRFQSFTAIAGLALLFAAGPLAAQDDAEKEPLRTRIGLGPQFYPAFPGAKDLEVSPLVEFSRARGDEYFEFEAPDESFGFNLVGTDRFSFGPAANFEGKRKGEDVGGLPDVGFSLELGGFAQYYATDSLRLRTEVRQAVTGHDGLIGQVSADYVMRDGDRQVISFGPRMTVSDGKYHDAYFSVSPEDSVVTGIPAFDAGGGIQSVGAAAAYIQQFTPRWGIYTFAKYDRLVSDAAKSPIVREFGSRDQFAFGAALTYTFGRGVR